MYNKSMSKNIEIKLYTNIINYGQLDWNTGYTLPNPPYSKKFKNIRIPTNEKLSFKSDINNFDKLMTLISSDQRRPATVGGAKPGGVESDVDNFLSKKD